MLKEKELSETGLDAIKNCLSLVPSLSIASIERAEMSQDPDYRIVINTENLVQILIVEIKPLGTPLSTTSAVNQLLRWINNEPFAYGVFVAPYISDRSAQICKDAGIGFVDLSGNCFLSFQNIFISRENRKNKYPFRSGVISVFSPKSERILRVLLAYPYIFWKTMGLAKEAQVSLGMVTQVSKKLIEGEWLKKTPQGIVLTQPEKLLTEWSKNYSFKKNVSNYYYTLKPVQEIENQIARICEKNKIPYGLTGFSASNRIAPFVKGQRATIYIGNSIELVAREAGLKSVDSGANIVLVQPYDDGVFWNAKAINGVNTIDPIQLYLDLLQLPGRGEEAANFLLQKVILPEWQQRNTNITTF